MSKIVIMESLGISDEELAARKAPFEAKGHVFAVYLLLSAYFFIGFQIVSLIKTAFLFYEVIQSHCLLRNGAVQGFGIFQQAFCNAKSVFV